MLLSEALAERAEISNRLTQLKARLHTVARIQEGDQPDEDPHTLIKESDALRARAEKLIRAINATNTATPFDGGNLTDALAHRDYLLASRRFYTDLADAASARQDRYSSSEIKYVATVNVAELRKRADAFSKEYRELDTRIQQLNWQTDLVGL